MQLTYSRPAEARTLGLGMVMQERSLIRTLSGLDNLYLNSEHKSAVGLVNVRKQRAEIAGLLEELAIPRALLSTMTSDMSTIEQELIEIAKALRLGSQVLILDEPTAPLGREEIARLFGVLKTIAARGAGIVVITHHLAEVFAVSDMVTCLREGQVVLQTATKHTNMAGLISAMLGRRPWEGAHLPAHGSKRVDAAARSASPKRPEPSLTVRNLKVGAKLADVSFEAFPGEVLGVVGLAGSGRTTLHAHALRRPPSGRRRDSVSRQALPPELDPGRDGRRASFSFRRTAASTGSCWRSPSRKTSSSSFFAV